MSNPTCETCRFFELFDHSEPRMVASNHPEELIEKWREKFGDASAEEMRTSTHKNQLRQGVCRRYPPSLPSPDEEDVLHFPNVPYYEWCGEHQPEHGNDVADECDGSSGLVYGTVIDKRLSWPLGRSERQARRGKLPHVVLPDGSIRFEWKEIEPLLSRVEAKAE